VEGEASTPTYDPNGNMTTDPNGDTYTYDAWNRLVKVSTPTDTITYTYDALGRRITESGSSTDTTTDLYYSSSDQVLEEQQYGATTTQYVWGPSYVNQLIEEAFYAGGVPTKFYVEQDANFNVTSLSNSSGAITERYEYDPYGAQTVMSASYSVISESACGNTVGFQGEQEDDDLGLFFADERVGSVDTGTWLTQDPSGAAGSGTNLEQFEDGNPVDLIDPTGLSWDWAHQGTEIGEKIFAAINNGNPNAVTNKTIKTLVQAFSGKLDPVKAFADMRPDVVLPRYSYDKDGNRTLDSLDVFGDKHGK
jgi:RHS repeat-associated protein